MSFITQRRVEFRDTDAAGIMHFSAFFPMMEVAEHAMLRSLGLSVLDRKDPNHVTWPRVSASCDYVAAARFEDVLDIEVQVGKIGNSSVHYAFHFRRDEETVARGKISAVCCRLPPNGGLEKLVIPDSIRDLLAKYK